MARVTASPDSGPEGMVVAGRYRIRRKLGSGSVGTVYLAESLSTGEEVALKVIRAEHLGAEGISRLQKEFRAIADLRHPQIAGARDFGYTDEDGLPFYTREYIDGIPLSPGPTGPRGQARPREFLRPILDLLDALQYLHTHEMLHLDIHAGNLIEARDPGRGAVLIDLGFVRLGRSRSSSGTGKISSSLPPELLAGESPGPAADIHSAGRLLLYRLSGHYEGSARLPREVPGWGARLTLELERIIEKALQPDPARRFGSAQEFREALSTALGEREGHAPLAEPGELTMGRDPEIESLEDAIRRAAEGKTGALWIFGPLGLGKSRLLTEARWRAQVLGVPVADIRFLPEAGSPPAGQQILRALRGTARSGLTWLSPLAAERGGSPAQRARRAATAYFAEPGPSLALLVDDFDRADKESRLLIGELLALAARFRAEDRATRGMAVVVASVQLPAEKAVADERKCPSLEIRPLPRKTSGALLETLLRPLKVPSALLARLAAEARGNPLRLRRLARFLRARFGASGSVPGDALEMRAGASSTWWGVRSAVAAQRRAHVEPAEQEVLRVLATFQQAVPKEEIVAASCLGEKAVDRALRELCDDELIDSLVEGRQRLFCLTDSRIGREVLRGIRGKQISSMHARAAQYLAGIRDPQPRQRASLARHLIAAGKQKEGRAAVLETVPLLVRQGLLDRAVRLLEEVYKRERGQRSRFRIAEEISEIHALAGDHVEGALALEPFVRAGAGRLGRREAVRLRRRLGVHYHRAGQLRKALRMLEEARRSADPVEDRKEVVHVVSELAEFHTLRGDYERAEVLCREGLDLLHRAQDDPPEFRRTMEVTLRASLGHLELRRKALDRSRREFEAALSLARAHASAADRAMILNNLGIVHNELNNFQAAYRFFRQADKLLARSGEGGAMVQAACNLALISAKLGNAPAAREEIERATRLLRDHSGERLEFAVGMSRALVDYHLGRMSSAIESFHEALPLGRKLGDDYLVRFGEIYVAEAHLSCGRYLDALRSLRSRLSSSSKAASPILERMALCRWLVVETILGREKVAERLRRLLERHPPGNIQLLEAWNQLFLSLAALMSPGRGPTFFKEAFATFRRMGLSFGARFARLGLIHEAVERQEAGRVRSLLIDLERESEAAHKILAVLEPLAAGEASLFLGEIDRASHYQQVAAGAIVGLPFLELDWRIEFLRATLASRQGDREVARHHLGRTLQARDLLARHVPDRLRDSFLAHSRFAKLRELQARLEASSATPSTPFHPGDKLFGEIVGSSEAMKRVFEMVDRLRAVDLPVLITGETGTGKELVARALHRTSSRREGPFYSLHCSSLPQELFESELFGYEAGAFTGAEESRPGLLEHLRGGTLLLDEITQLSPSTQAKLLQVMDTMVVRPLGSLETRPVDVRFLASSSVDPALAVRSGDLRQDLYYRLRVAEIPLPPLRDRREDIACLARHFLELHAERLERSEPPLTREAMACLERHDWPGNVRELETVIIRLVLEASPGAAIGPERVKEVLAPSKAEGLFPDGLLAGREIKELRRELERAYLLRLFRETGGKIPKLLERLGIRRSNFYTWLRKVGLDVEEMRRRL